MNGALATLVGMILLAHTLGGPLPARAESSNVLAAVPATISVCFAPEDDCAGFVADGIDGAKQTILANAYNLTTGAGIVEALVRAKQRGVDVQLIADKTSPCEKNAGVEVLATAGVPIWIDHVVRIAHAKVFVIDGHLTLAGSYNWSTNAAHNSEDMNAIESSAIAADYAVHWQKRLAASSVFKDRLDWCKK